MDSAPGVERARGTEPVGGAVTVRYWAGARAAAGTDTDALDGPTTVADLRAELTHRHAPLAEVLPVCSLLVDGLAAADDATVPAGSVVEVLPPFAGG